MASVVTAKLHHLHYSSNSTICVKLHLNYVTCIQNFISILRIPQYFLCL